MPGQKPGNAARCTESRAMTPINSPVSTWARGNTVHTSCHEFAFSDPGLHMGPWVVGYKPMGSGASSICPSSRCFRIGQLQAVQLDGYTREKDQWPMAVAQARHVCLPHALAY